MLVALTPFHGNAQENGATLQVFVEPAGARLELLGDVPSDEIRTLDNGERRSLPPGRYAVNASAEGYQSQVQTVSLGAGEVHRLEIRLSRAQPPIFKSTMGFLALFTFGLLLYLYLVQSRFYRLAESAVGRIREFRTTHTPSIEEVANTAVRLNADKENVKPIEIEGPLTVPVGVRSSTFVARHRDNNVLENVTWEVAPADGASIVPTSKPHETQVIAAKPGALTLEAKWVNADDEGNPVVYQGVAHFVAVEAEPASFEVPWVGSGYGTILLAVILIGVLMILGFFEVVDGGTIGTILGAIAGLMFGGTMSDWRRQPREGDSAKGGGESR